MIFSATKRRIDREDDVIQGGQMNDGFPVVGELADARCGGARNGKANGEKHRPQSRAGGSLLPRIWHPARAVQHAEAAFTLMELLVVIAIMVIVMGVTIPMVSRLSHGNAVSQTQNMVTAYMASARATALAMKTPVAVVFFVDQSGPQPRPAVQLVKQVPYAADINEAHFVAIPEKPVEYLPQGIEVVTISDKYGPLRSADSFSNCRVVLFDGEGQVLLRDGLVGENAAWNMNGTRMSQPSYVRGNSAPGVIVYDAAGLTQSGLTGAAAEDWIFKNGTVMVLNAYTGNVNR